MLNGFGSIGNDIVAQHLAGQRNRRNRRFQLVCHVVDEIIFHFRQPFLPEDCRNSIGEGVNNYDDENDGDLTIKSDESREM